MVNTLNSIWGLIQSDEYIESLTTHAAKIQARHLSLTGRLRKLEVSISEIIVLAIAERDAEIMQS